MFSFYGCFLKSLQRCKYLPSNQCYVPVGSNIFRLSWSSSSWRTRGCDLGRRKYHNCILLAASADLHLRLYVALISFSWSLSKSKITCSAQCLLALSFGADSCSIAVSQESFPSLVLCESRQHPPCRPCLKDAQITPAGKRQPCAAETQAAPEGRLAFPGSVLPVQAPGWDESRGPQRIFHPDTCCRPGSSNFWKFQKWNMFPSKGQIPSPVLKVWTTCKSPVSNKFLRAFSVAVNFKVQLLRVVSSSFHRSFFLLRLQFFGAISD